MLNKKLALIALVVFAAGCGVETRTYVMTKDRVGLNQNGNGGCVVGKCPPAPTPAETTRKVYVLEITKPVPESQVRKIEQTAANTVTQSVETPPVNETAPATAPAENEAAAPAAPTVPVVGELPGAGAPSQPAAAAAVNGGNVQETTYTVQKDDTLQKISKKVYGTYAKWYKIYKANKDKIKNPNVLRTGTVLTIPPLK